MSKNPLFLSADGLYRLSQQQQEQSARANWRLSGSLCLVARACYWEQIVYYPTSNLVEVQKIVAAEINQVSPLPGKTRAFVIHSSQGKTSVLYCCFTQALMEKAEQLQLWRLIPETLPLYRSLSTQTNLHLIDLELVPYYGSSLGDSLERINHRLVVSTRTNSLSSLPVENEQTPPLSSEIISEARTIGYQEYLLTLSKFRALDYLDFIVQVSEQARNTFAKNKQLPALICLFVAFSMLAFTLGKSAHLLWQHDSLTEQISATRSEATHSIKLLNELKQARSDISTINQHLASHGSKTQVFALLSTMIEENPALSFKTVNISPADIRLQGVTDSASNLLARLSEVPGFNDVQFGTPPRPVKNIGERFNITITYDQGIYKEAPST